MNTPPRVFQAYRNAGVSPPKALIPSWKEYLTRGATAPAGVTEEHLQGPETAGFRMGRSALYP